MHIAVSTLAHHRLQCANSGGMPCRGETGELVQANRRERKIELKKVSLFHQTADLADPGVDQLWNPKLDPNQQRPAKPLHTIQRTPKFQT